jgi:predicted ArsR family transcriptional regulator
MARQLHKLYVALEAIGIDAAATLVKVGLDSIPSPRREVLRHLLEHGEERTTSHVARALRLPTVSTRRALEELAAHNLLGWRKGGDAKNAAHMWKATETALELWRPLDAIAVAKRD